MQKSGMISTSQGRDSALERSEAAIVERLNDGLEARSRRFPLQFPEPLEHSFHLFNAGQALSALRGTCVLLLAVLLVTGTIDAIVTPDLAAALWQVRIPAVGVSLALILLSYTPGFVVYQHWVVLAFLGASSMAYLNLSRLEEAPFNYLYVALLSITPFFLLLMSRSLFKWALACCVALLLGADFYWVVLYPVDSSVLLVYNAMLLSCLGMGLFANILNEKEIRSAYLHLQHERLSRFDRGELEDSNDRFRFLVSLDSVTGIANKNSLERGLKLEWDRAARRKQYLSLLVVSVDYFDEYQQCYGMVESDQCLKKVAAELKRFARRPGDIAARFGRDQFYVVLADTGIENAMYVAQNMLDNIRSLEIANQFSKSEPTLTVSIGVASVIPLPSMFPADLVDKAKRANKAAKKQSNQVISFADLF